MATSIGSFESAFSGDLKQFSGGIKEDSLMVLFKNQNRNSKVALYDFCEFSLELLLINFGCDVLGLESLG